MFELISISRENIYSYMSDWWHVSPWPYLVHLSLKVAHPFCKSLKHLHMSGIWVLKLGFLYSLFFLLSFQLPTSLPGSSQTLSYLPIPESLWDLNDPFTNILQGVGSSFRMWSAYHTLRKNWCYSSRSHQLFIDPQFK